MLRHKIAHWPCMWSISSFLLHSLNETFFSPLWYQESWLYANSPPSILHHNLFLTFCNGFLSEGEGSSLHSYWIRTIHVPHSSFCPSQSRIWLFWGWYWTLGGHGTVYHTIPFTQHAESVSASHRRLCVWQSNSSDVTIFAPHHNDGSVFIPRQNRNLREGSVASQRRANMAE